MKDNNIFHNAEGIKDETAGFALRNIRIQQTHEEARALLARLREVAKKEGWTFSGSLTFVNTKTRFYAEIRNV